MIYENYDYIVNVWNMNRKSNKWAMSYLGEFDIYKNVFRVRDGWSMDTFISTCVLYECGLRGWSPTVKRFLGNMAMHYTLHTSWAKIDYWYRLRSICVELKDLPRPTSTNLGKIYYFVKNWNAFSLNQAQI